MAKEKIENKGNLPNHLQVFAKALEGHLSVGEDTEFYEYKTIREFEKDAHMDNEGFEIIPTIDTSTDRGFLVGFSVAEPKKIVTMTSYAKLTIYFVEATSQEVEQWTTRIIQDRLNQQEDMYNRRAKTQDKMRRRNPLTIKGD